MNTFKFNRAVRHNIIRTLISSGIPARDAVAKITRSHGYLFMSAAECDAYDSEHPEAWLHTYDRNGVIQILAKNLKKGQPFFFTERAAMDAYKEKYKDHKRKALY